MLNGASNGRIGLVGLGLVGSALSERFQLAGKRVAGYDVDPATMERFAASGGETAASASEVAASCARIVFSLPTSDTVGLVLDEISAALSPGVIIIDSTTGAPEQIERFGRRLAARQVGYLDATIGGSSEQVRTGEAIVICGGEKADFTACEDVFTLFSRRAFHVGPCGSGAKMKLVMNLVLGLQRAVLAEGLSYASACGLDAGYALQILLESPAYSRVMDLKGQKMLDGDFSAVARLSQHLKDVRLIVDSAERSGATVPLSRLHRELLEGLEEAGYGAEDNSAVIRAFRPRNAVHE